MGAAWYLRGARSRRQDRRSELSVFNLAITGATIVIPRGRRRCSVHIEGESIAAIDDARRTVDANGLHLLQASSTATCIFKTLATPHDFKSGRARLADPDWPLRGPLARWCDLLKSIYVHHARRAGHDPARLLALLRELAAVNAQGLVHCEDESITSENERALREAGRSDPAVSAEWRTREAELTALSTLGLLARITGVRAIAAHPQPSHRGGPLATRGRSDVLGDLSAVPVSP